MKRTALALIFTIALLLSVMAGTKMVNLAEANPWPPGYFPPPPPYVIIQSPQDRVYYDTELILLNFTFKANSELNPSASLFYLLDGKDYRLESVKVEEVTYFVLDEEDYHAGYEGHVLLSNLSDGPHTLIVFAGYADSDGVINGSIGNDAKVNFSIEPEPFPTTMVATASGVSAALACLGLLVYFKKRRR
jgi:hypothetical protein